MAARTEGNDGSFARLSGGFWARDGTAPASSAILSSGA